MRVINLTLIEMKLISKENHMNYFILSMAIIFPCCGVVTHNQGTSKYTVDSSGAPMDLPCESKHSRNLSDIEYENEVYKFNDREMKSYESLKEKGVWVW